MTAHDQLTTLLTERQIPHAVEHGGLHIHAGLFLDAPHIEALPDDLTVHGFLDLTGASLTHLPERLVVETDLLLDASKVTGLPASLRVGDDLALRRCKITQLPKGLRVIGSLHLDSTPILALPDGLDVGGDLILWNTPITRLPQDLRVGHLIRPPSGLHDVLAFLATRTEDTVLLSNATTQHQRLALAAELRPYPDLWRIVLSMGMHQDLELERTPQGGYLPSFPFRGQA